MGEIEKRAIRYRLRGDITKFIDVDDIAAVYICIGPKFEFGTVTGSQVAFIYNGAAVLVVRAPGEMRKREHF